MRAARDKIAAQFDYDIGRIFDHFVSLDRKRRQAANPQPRTANAKLK